MEVVLNSEIGNYRTDHRFSVFAWGFLFSNSVFPFCFAGKGGGTIASASDYAIGEKLADGVWVDNRRRARISYEVIRGTKCLQM
jgi:hypothetical protein